MSKKKPEQYTCKRLERFLLIPATLRPQLIVIRGTAWYVFSSQEHRQPNVPISVSMHLPRCCFFTWLFGTGRRFRSPCNSINQIAHCRARSWGRLRGIDACARPCQRLSARRFRRQEWIKKRRRARYAQRDQNLSSEKHDPMWTQGYRDACYSYHRSGSWIQNCHHETISTIVDLMKSTESFPSISHRPNKNSLKNFFTGRSKKIEKNHVRYSAVKIAKENYIISYCIKYHVLYSLYTRFTDERWFIHSLQFFVLRA